MSIMLFKTKKKKSHVGDLRVLINLFIPYEEAVGKRLNNNARLITTQPVSSRDRIDTQVLHYYFM